jgi:hypothetical protein
MSGSIKSMARRAEFAGSGSLPAGRPAAAGPVALHIRSHLFERMVPGDCPSISVTPPQFIDDLDFINALT